MRDVPPGIGNQHLLEKVDALGHMSDGVFHTADARAIDLQAQSRGGDVLEARHQIVEPERRGQQGVLRFVELDGPQRRQAQSQDVFLGDVDAANPDQAGELHRCAAQNGQQCRQRAARFVGSLLGFCKRLHRLLVLRRELLPLQLE